MSAGVLIVYEGKKPATKLVFFRGTEAVFTYPRLGRYKGDIFDGLRAIARHLLGREDVLLKRGESLETEEAEQMVETMMEDEEISSIEIKEIVIRLRWAEDGERPNWETR